MAGVTVSTRRSGLGLRRHPEDGSLAPPPSRRVPPPGLVLALASLGAFAALLDATIVNVAFPSMQRSFPETSASQLSWVLSAYNLTFAAFVVAGGRFADLLGRRRTFSIALAGFTLASALCAVAPSVPVLIGTRVLQALFSALLLPSSRGLVLAAYPVERRAHAVATWTAVSAAAGGIGPTLGAILVGASSWRLVFLVNIPVGIGGIVLVGRNLVESRAPGRRRGPDLGSSLTFATATGLLVLGIIQGDDWGWTDLKVLGAFAVAVLLMTGFVWRCRRAADPLIDLDLFRNRSFSVANSMMLVSSVGFYGTLLSSVLFLTAVWRYPILHAGLALTPGPLLAIVVSSVCTPIRARVGLRPVLAIGGLAWAGSTIWLAERVEATPHFLTGWLPGMLLFGVGAGLTVPSMGAASVASIRGGSFASTSALNTVARQVGAALGVALTVAILGRPGPETAVVAFHGTWWFAGGCFLLASIESLVLGRVRTQTAAPTDDPSIVAPIPSSALSAPHAPRRSSSLPVAFDHNEVRPLPESITDFLHRVPMLASLPASLLQSLAARAKSVTIGPDEWLFRQGDEAHEMFIVRAG
ncbi:MAG: MFS transporter, partial [Solirubrobacterales bacterium]|nr:MFS transporter [Solirubrobacterales bacterium]